MRTFTRGRLVPRQPRAIKRTTRTELRGESIFIVKYIHWNTGIKPTALHHENICNGKYIHLNIGTTLTALSIRIFVMANELIGVVMMLITNGKMDWCKSLRNLPYFIA